MTVFIIVFGLLILFAVDLFGTGKFKLRFYALIAFVFGSISSIICGYIGMMVAVRTNYRVSYLAITSLDDAFKIAYQAGCVMGYFTVSFELIGILLIFIIY